MKGAVKSITIRGFKSIRNLEGLELTNLNVVIGANGAGKSNLVQVFQMLRSMTLEGFQKFIGGNGGADSFLHNGPKHTEEIYLELEFESGSPASKGSNFYKCQLTPTVSETFLVEEYRRYLSDGAWRLYGSPSQESRLREMRDETSHTGMRKGVGYLSTDRSPAGWSIIFTILDHSRRCGAQRLLKITKFCDTMPRISHHS